MSTPFIAFIINFRHHKKSILTYLTLILIFSLQGIGIINNLQAKLENAPTQSMKEKFESDMKKEIKKLQRLRDFFRTN